MISPYILDYLMILSSGLGLLAGLALPDLFCFFTPYALLFVALAQFISFMPVRLRSLFRLSVREGGEVALWSGLKLLVLPLFLWLLTSLIAPEQVPGMIMSGGTATAVMAPMVVGFLRGNVVRMTQIVIVTSVAMPFTVPFLLNLHLDAAVSFDLSAMALTLSLAVIPPSLLVLFMRRFTPNCLRAIAGPAPYVGRFMGFFMVAGVIAPYSHLVIHNPGHSLFLFALAFGAVFLASGMGFGISLLLGMPATTGGLVLGFNNFGVAAVAAGQFLGFDATMLALGFILPGFMPVPLLRLWLNHTLSRANNPPNGII
jgi:BASS family bile acid:Na+ symporter